MRLRAIALALRVGLAFAAAHALNGELSARPVSGFVRIRVIAFGFSRRCDVVRARMLENLLGFLDPLGVIRMNGEKDAAAFDAPFVARG